MASQGQCKKCGIKYRWGGDWTKRKENNIPLNQTQCPKCHSKLEHVQASLGMDYVSVEDVKLK